jgi:hypothetical protein
MAGVPVCGVGGRQKEREEREREREKPHRVRQEARGRPGRAGLAVL